MVEGFVIDRRWRVQCGTCFGHLDKKAKEGKEKGRKTKVDGVTQQTRKTETKK